MFVVTVRLMSSDLICDEGGEDFFIETPLSHPASVIFTTAGDENFGEVCDADCVTLQLPIMTLSDFVCLPLA